MKKTFMIPLFLILCLPSILAWHDACFLFDDHMTCLSNISASVIDASNVTNPFWLNLTDQRYNDTSLANSKALPGVCPAGQFVNSTTTMGVLCGSPGVATGDGNNYTTGVSVSGTDTKTIHITRSGMSEINATFTDISGGGGTTYYNGTGILETGTTFSLDKAYTDSLYYALSNPNGYINVSTGLNSSQVVSAVGNWTADKTSYNTTSQLNTLYYSITNPSGFYNSTSPPPYVSAVGNYTANNRGDLNASGVVSAVGNYTGNSMLFLNATGVNNAVGNYTGNSRGDLNASGVVSAVGNWTSDKTSYNTTSQLDTRYIRNNSDAVLNNLNITKNVTVSNGNGLIINSSVYIIYNGTTWIMRAQ